MNDQNHHPSAVLTAEHASAPLGTWQSPDQTARAVEQLVGEAANYWLSILSPAFAIAVHNQLAARLKQAAVSGLGERKAAVIAGRLDAVLQDTLSIDWAPVSFAVSLSDANCMILKGSFASTSVAVGYAPRPAAETLIPAIVYGTHHAGHRHG